jgi:hypothetical protein
VLRNVAVSGELRITDNRAGIVLSTREALDHMTPAQYLASFIYWTRGPGPGLARRLFGPEVTGPLGLDEPDGFYFNAQEGYSRRVDALAKAQNIGVFAASGRIDGEVVGAIFAHPLAYAATMLPILYRGFWIDDFALIGIPALIFATWRAWRRREVLRLLLLSVGIYNEVFHALITLNIPRYQITAMPSIAIAVALTFAFLLRRFSGKVSGIGLPSIAPAIGFAGANALVPAEASQTPLAHSVPGRGHDRKPG